MARTVVAIYENFQTANSAVRELVDSGFSRETISIVANNARGEFGMYTPGKGTTEATPVADETGAGAGVGAGIGAAIGGIGGLLVGLGALVIPGIGPVLAAGPLAIALSTLTGAGVGAVAGGVTGGLLGALIGLGVPESEAQYYAEGVRRGGVLVTVQADEYNANQITEVLNRYNPMDIQGRATHWREEGWTGFDPNAAPVTTTSLDQRQVPHTGDTMADTTIDVDNNVIGNYGSSTVAPDLATSDVTRGSAMGSAFNAQNDSYRNHYTSYLRDSGYQYEDYLPAYQYGYSLRANPSYRGRRWEEIEPEIQHGWDNFETGTWQRVKMAIRHAWEDVTD